MGGFMSETKPVVNNNEQYANYLKNYPPQYALGDAVKFLMNERGGASNGYISGMVFKDREKTWKYTCKVYATNMHTDAFAILERVVLP